MTPPMAVDRLRYRDGRSTAHVLNPPKIGASIMPRQVARNGPQRLATGA